MRLVRTGKFDAWLAGIRDEQIKLRLLRRLDRLAQGNPGDVRPVGEGVSELRVDAGPGYRIYYVRGGGELAIILAGGDKSTQATDIVRAKQLARAWSRSHGV